VTLTGGPTSPGKLFTAALHWSFMLRSHEFVLRLNSKKLPDSVLTLEGLPDRYAGLILHVLVQSGNIANKQ